MKKALSIVAIVIVVVLVGAFIFLKGKRFDIVIPQATIDSALAENFPASKDYRRVFSLEFSNPQVTLIEATDRIQVGMDVSLKLRQKEGPGKLGGGATVSAGLRYDEQTHAFFLDETVIDRMEIPGVPDDLQDRVAQVGSQAINQLLEERPVYQLEATNIKTAAAKMLLKGFEVRDQAIHVTIGI